MPWWSYPDEDPDSRLTRGCAAPVHGTFVVTCHITRNGTRITCSRIDGGAEGVMLHVEKDAHRRDQKALSVDGKELALQLLEKTNASLSLRSAVHGTHVVGWLNWVEAKKPGGGANALEEILISMRRRGVRVVGIEIARRDGGDVQALIDFYKERGFVRDTSFTSQRPVMIRELT